MKKIMILITAILMTAAFAGCEKKGSTVSSVLDSQAELYSLTDSETIEDSSLEDEVNEAITSESATEAVTIAPPTTTTTQPTTSATTTPKTTTAKAATTTKPDMTTPSVTTAPPATNTTPKTTPASTTTAAPLTSSQFVSEVVRLVNEERAKEGLSPLTESAELNNAALIRANEAIELMSHTRPDGRDWNTVLKDQNISYRSAGENIACGQKTPAEVVKDWMNSPGHRANIMNGAYAKIGVGYVAGGSYKHYWAQLFTN